ncbi:MerR family transcriptional regulator [Pseudonocardiaceae bacterium YIM PH 21723]|nr:MerR family transcriptional regulator [Pseudonocardiaceae bacterium YIM PH 21723]
MGLVRTQPETAVGGESAFDEADSVEPRLTVAAVARQLGVAPATLRTWDRRYGLGPSDHTSGRHRRYGPTDIARLELMQRALLRGASPAEAARYALSVPIPRPDPEAAKQSEAKAEPAPERSGVLLSGSLLVGGTLEEIDIDERARAGGRALALTGAGRKARGLGRAVLAMDTLAVLAVLADSVDEDGVATTWDEVISPVMAAVTTRWDDYGARVAMERLLSECVRIAFSQAIMTAPAPGNPRPVLLACVPGDTHSLPLYALAAELSRCGIGCQVFGASLPAEALAAAIRRTAPAAVVLRAQLPSDADPGLIAALPKTRPRVRVFVTGPGWEAAGNQPGTELLAGLRPAVARLEQVFIG